MIVVQLLAAAGVVVAIGAGAIVRSARAFANDYDANERSEAIALSEMQQPCRADQFEQFKHSHTGNGKS